MSTFGRRLDRLEARIAPVEPSRRLSPERWEALMHKLAAVGLAAWSEAWRQWYPPEPHLLKQLLRERAGRDR